MIIEVQHLSPAKLLTLYLAVLCLVSGGVYGQANHGELRLHVTDPSGGGVRATVHLSSEANQYRADLETDKQGRVDAARLPYGIYRLDVDQAGFAAVSETISIRSSIPLKHSIALRLATVEETISVQAASTLIDPEQPGNVDQVGATSIQRRLGSIPGRSLQDLVNSQPGWLFEGNAVLHPRGSENQTQFVVDGIPLTDNRSPSFGPEIGADDVESLSIYTAGIPAEYGRKLGGVVEVNTERNAQPGFHGDLGLAGGSFGSGSAFAQGQYTSGKNTLGASASGGRTDHYLNPVVPQNYSNRGTLGDFSGRFERDVTSNDRVSMTVRHELSRYDIPNELIQQAAGQRQTADNIETMGIASYEHTFSPRTLARFAGMVRENANDFNSNPESTPVEVFQHNRFREGYFRATLTASRGIHEWKTGFESDNTFLHENTSYEITDPSRFDDGTPLTFGFAGERPDLEQSIFVQDLIHLGKWSINAGLRWDHYQLLVNRQSVQPRFAISRHFDSTDSILHFSYDRVFQTPSSQNILLSSSAEIEALDPTAFLRLPVEPSVGDYFEGGWTQSVLGKAKLDVNYFRRVVNNFADDDQVENTSISFPISFRKAIVYGAEGKLDIPAWRKVSGFLSYSYQVGNSWNPVTGGLFLGDSATDATTNLTGHFPSTQDQRNTLRGQVRYQAHPRFWMAGGVQYDSGLPFEFDGDPDTVLAQYGRQVLDRINFDRGRILPAFQVNASAGAELYRRGDKVNVRLQADGQNLNNVLDVIDFGGLFSGNAIGPPRSFFVRLTGTF
ncbi:MAG: TonB-dependent receptor [Acidobacteria bacterium]|nr:TonB-dependent receptor [Acidobacteriota bacterium]